MATIMQLIDEQKLFDRLPTYVAASVDRLPTTPIDSIDVTCHIGQEIPYLGKENDRKM